MTLSSALKSLLTDGRWPLLELIAAQLVGVVDLALAGHLQGDVVIPATAAVGIAGYLVWLLMLLIQALVVAVTALAGKAVGAEESPDSVGAAGLWIGLVAGVVLAGSLWFVAPHIAGLITMDIETAHYLALYLRILTPCLPLIALTQVAVGMHRACGNQYTPFVVAIAVNLVNVAASYLLVRLLGGFIGIPLGTCCAWVCGGVIACRGMLARFSSPRDNCIRPLLRLAGPALVDSLWVWGGQMIVIWYISVRLGSQAMGAHATAIRLVSLSLLPAMALGLAVTPAVSRALGAKGPAGGVRVGMAAAILGAVCGLATAVPLYGLRHPLAAFLVRDPELQRLAAGCIAIITWTQMPYGAYYLVSRACQGLGQTQVSMTLNCLTVICVLLPGIYFFGEVFAWGIFGVWAAFSCERVCNALLFITWLMVMHRRQDTDTQPVACVRYGT